MPHSFNSSVIFFQLFYGVCSCHNSFTKSNRTSAVFEISGIADIKAITKQWTTVLAVRMWNTVTTGTIFETTFNDYSTFDFHILLEGWLRIGFDCHFTYLPVEPNPPSPRSSPKSSTTSAKITGSITI